MINSKEFEDVRFLIEALPGEYIYTWAERCVQKIQIARQFTNKPFKGMFNGIIIPLENNMSAEDIVTRWNMMYSKNL